MGRMDCSGRPGSPRLIANAGEGSTKTVNYASASNVWTYPGASLLNSDARRGLKDRPTVKPTSMLKDALLDLTRRGDFAIDPSSAPAPRSSPQRPRAAFAAASNSIRSMSTSSFDASRLKPVSPSCLRRLGSGLRIGLREARLNLAAPNENSARVVNSPSTNRGRSRCAPTGPKRAYRSDSLPIRTNRLPNFVKCGSDPAAKRNRRC